MKNSNFEFQIDLSVNCIFIKHHGHYNFEINVARGKAVSKHENYRPGLNRLVVATDCEPDLKMEDIRRLSELIKRESSARGNYREAIYLNTMLGHGIARMFDSLKKHDGAEYQIFHKDSENVMNRIKDWLGLQSDFELPSFLNAS